MAGNIKAIGTRIPLEVFGQGRFEVIDEIVLPDVREHGTPPPGMPSGRDGLKAIARAIRTAFPDIACSLELAVEEGDLLAIKVKYTGTMTGELWGMPATGRQATWTESHFSRITNGKITDHWGDIDSLGMLRQLGLAPAPTAAASR